MWHFNLFVLFTLLDRECNSTDIRLVGGSSMWRGRVDICLDGVWGAVCADGLNNPAASVICRWLGFPDAGRIK